MGEIQVVEKNSERVLLTSQLAEVYVVEEDAIRRNYNRNKERYVEGKHYHIIDGNELKHFKAKGQFDLLPNVNKLFLWTEKGALLHAKSLNTDKAWEVYDVLVDSYFSKEVKKDVSQLSPELQMFSKIFDSLATQELQNKQLANEVAATKEQVANISEIVALNSTDWKKETTAIIQKIAKKNGGGDQYQEVRNESYDILEFRASAKLSIRLENKRKNMAISGASKTAIAKASKLDIIGEDKRLLEIYLAVVKEMAIRASVQ